MSTAVAETSVDFRTNTQFMRAIRRYFGDNTRSGKPTSPAAGQIYDIAINNGQINPKIPPAPDRLADILTDTFAEFCNSYAAAFKGSDYQDTASHAQTNGLIGQAVDYAKSTSRGQEMHANRAIYAPASLAVGLLAACGAYRGFDGVYKEKQEVDKLYYEEGITPARKKALDKERDALDTKSNYWLGAMFLGLLSGPLLYLAAAVRTERHDRKAQKDFKQVLEEIDEAIRQEAQRRGTGYQGDGVPSHSR